ncbi:hypothetical protein NHG22_29685 [Streptomyces sp. ATE26]|uniref:hypothetical protein n=1 Tax=Streptomyces sp. ATE26 TaxID=2954237 RepID=UPI0024823665|nr:hypothetical protein [Streptomyces sp. ATE26]MDI1457944.1 hypothetical protein [Streptomyces sp. ATE26]
MTTATARVRTAAAAAGLVGALALTACSGGGADDDSSPAPAPTAATESASGSTGTVTGASAELQGSWVATGKGSIVALVITGKRAGLFVTGGSMCSGTAGAESGMRMIHLTCTDGTEDRVTGMVDSVTKDALKVTWSGKVGHETYTKAEGGKLPSGMPTTLKR